MLGICAIHSRNFRTGVNGRQGTREIMIAKAKPCLKKINLYIAYLNAKSLCQCFAWKPPVKVKYKEISFSHFGQPLTGKISCKRDDNIDL